MLIKLCKDYAKAAISAGQNLFTKHHVTNACSLAYTTLLSIIPLISIMIYAASFSPRFAELSLYAKKYATKTLLPESNTTVIDHLDALSQQATHIPASSFLFLFITAVLLMKSIDSTMTMAWQIRHRNPGILKLSIYVLSIFAIPLIIALGSIISATVALAFDSIPFLSTPTLLLPLIIDSIMLAALYGATSSRNIKARHIIIGSVLTAILLETVKLLFALYTLDYSNYGTIYGALAIIPSFLLWIFVFWTTIIYGALFIKQLQVIRTKPAAKLS